jgi:hypothetical protein
LKCQNTIFLNSFLALYRPEGEEIFFIIIHWIYIKKGYVESETVKIDFSHLNC